MPADETDSRLRWYGTVVQAMGAIVWEADGDLAFTFVSPHAEALLGYPCARWLADPSFGMERVHPGDRDRFRQLLAADTARDGFRSFDCRLIAADGRILHFRNLVSVDSSDGRALKWRGLLIDITRDKEAELALRQRTESYIRIAETAQQGVWQIDEHARIGFANRKLADMLGYLSSELTGRDLFELVDPRADQPAREYLARLRQGSSEQHELVFLRRDRTQLWTAVVATPLRDEQGRDRGSIAVVTDVSAQRRTKALLATQRKVFEILVHDEPHALQKSLTTLVRAIEEVTDGMSASVLLLDREGQHLLTGAAPSLPAVYSQAINGAAIGPCAGSCGTAAYRKEIVITPDIRTDPLWAAYKHLAEPHGLRACWSSPILHRSGRVLGTFAMYFRDVRRPTTEELEFVRDATAAAALVIEHVETRQSLDTTISLLEATLEASADGILVLDNSGTIQRLNRRFVEQWQIPEELMASHDGRRVLAYGLSRVNDPETALRQIRDLQSASPETRSLDTLELKDGRVFERYYQAQMLGGERVGRAWSFRDITRQKRAERELKESEDRFRALSDAATEAIIIHERGVIRLANKGAEQMFGYDPGELTGKDANELAREDFRAATRQSVQSSGDQTYEAIGLRKDGSTFWGEVRSRVTEYEGRPARVTGIRDITDRRLLEEARERLLAQEREARLQAERSVRLYDDFLALASHELKTPLTPLKTYLQLLRLALQEQPLPDPHRTELLREALQNTDREYDRLLRLIDDLLDVSSLTAGRLLLTREPCDLGLLVREVVACFSSEARRARCDLRVEAQPGVVASWDGVRIRQVVTTLLSNALKFGAGHPIDVQVARMGERATLAVTDHGIGIDAREQQRIFERFARAAPIQHYGGLGLGLYIAREILTAHGGTITVTSEPGKGARFLVELPI
jgi:PAS domain S-box-containing protein